MRTILVRGLLRSSLNSSSFVSVVRVVRPTVVHPRRAMSSSSNQSPPENTSPAQVPLDKSPDNWFAKFSRATETPKDCFKGYSDRFNGITVDSSFEGAEQLDFGKKLEGSVNDLCPEMNLIRRSFDTENLI